MFSFKEANIKLSTPDLKVKSFHFEGELHLLQQANLQDFPFLLESVAKSSHLSAIQSPEELARYTILFAYPQQTYSLENIANSSQFITDFNQEFSQQRQKIDLDSYTSIDLPFKGGWFCYFSYDYAEVVEPILNLPQSKTPLAMISRVPCAFILDKEKGLIHLVAEKAFESKLVEMEQWLQQTVDAVDSSKAKLSTPVNKKIKQQEEPENKYLSGIAKIKEYILSGDIFQVNLSRQWQIALDNDTSAIDVYAALRQHNPAPFSAFVQFEGFSIVSSSPERLVKYSRATGWVETRPIAGTRKRSQCIEEDIALIEELISHPKEIAEHIMLIDLERNDLGRICQPGTVEVNELMTVESYKHVHHIVSNVRGKLAPSHQQSPLDIIHAVFPGGTITGCPKIRCMEIIAELEQMPREAYTGSLGYFNLDGSLDTNILIRTMMYQDHTISFRAGAGVVADSIAENELQEARQKAKGLIHALAD